MKKILVLLLVMFLVSGCTSIKDAKMEEIINNVITSKYKLYNTVNRGYKYYLPSGLKTVKQDEYNVIISSKYYDYYLYVDLVKEKAIERELLNNIKEKLDEYTEKLNGLRRFHNLNGMTVSFEEDWDNILTIHFIDGGNDPDKLYEVSVDLSSLAPLDPVITIIYGIKADGDNFKTYKAYGSELMNMGLVIERLWLTIRGGDYSSLIFTLKEV